MTGHAARRAAWVALVLAGAAALSVTVGVDPAAAQDVTNPIPPATAPVDPTPAIDSWFGGDGLPTDGFDIGYAPPGWNDFTAKVGGFLLQVSFAAIKLLASGTVAVLEWGFAGRIADAMAGIIDPTATRFHVALFGSEHGLYDFALFLAVFIAGIQALRGRLTQAAGELVMTWLVAVCYLSTFAFAAGGFSGVVDGMRSTASGLSAVLVEATMGTPASCNGIDEAAAVMCPLRAGFHEAFVVGPYDQLNWGRDLGAASDPANPVAACAAARDDLVATGPHGTDDQPRTAMTAAGCAAEASYQATVTAERVLLGFVVASVSVVMLAVVLVIGLNLTMLQLGVALGVMLLPFAVLGGLVPGPSRALLWRWLSWAAKLVAGVVAMALLLAIYLVVITETMAATQGMATGMRFVSLLVPALALWWGRRRMAKAAKAIGAQTGTALDRATPGRAAGGTINQAAAAFDTPTYRGMTPNRYSNPNVRYAMNDARAARRAIQGRRSRRRAAKALQGGGR